MIHLRRKVVTLKKISSQWNNQQLYIHADGVWQLGSEQVAAKTQRCESTGEEVVLEEHAGGRPNHPQIWLEIHNPMIDQTLWNVVLEMIKTFS